MTINFDTVNNVGDNNYHNNVIVTIKKVSY